MRAPFLMLETRLNLDQASPGSTIEITLSKTANFERRLYHDIRVASSESDFAREHLANDASLYFRPYERSPRTFLWRLLDDRKALEVQAVDLSQDESEKMDAMLTILLRFPAAIRPHCLAFADPEERDAINVFAITSEDELWTLTLPRDFFINAKATENLADGWCKVLKPSIFSVTKPFRVFAASSRELFVSMAGGQIVRSTRRVGEDGTKWHDTVYSERSWSSSFGLSSWRGASGVRHEDIDVNPAASLSIHLTPFDEDDAHLVTVCLDHTMRIWNLKTGKVTCAVDILGEEDQKYFISASQRQLLQVLEMPGRQEFYVITFSPKQRQFRFWAIFDAEAGRQGIREMRSDIDYKPPVAELTSCSVWDMEEFHLYPSRGQKQSELWIRIRAGQASHVFMLSFDPFDFGHKLHDVESSRVRAAWEQDWVSVGRGHQSVEYLDDLKPRDLINDLSTPELTAIWLDFLFYPGRFTIPILEASLETYRAASGQASSTFRKDPLKDRITKSIWSSVARTGGIRTPGVDAAARQSWQNFYSVLRDLFKRSTEILSFAMDEVDQQPWLALADKVSPIRACSVLETIAINSKGLTSIPHSRSVYHKLDPPENVSVRSEEADEEDTDMGSLWTVAHSFRSSQTADFSHRLQQAIKKDLIERPDQSALDRLHNMQVESGLFDQLTEDDEELFDDLATAHGGFHMFGVENFGSILETLRETESGKSPRECITRYGARMLTRVAQESIALNIETLLDLLALVLYLEGSFEPKDLAAAIKGDLGEDESFMDVDGVTFDASPLFEKMMELLRENILLQFLTSNTRREKSKERRSSVGDSPVAKIAPAPTYATLLQSIFIGDWSELKVPEEISMLDWIRYVTTAWLTKLVSGRAEETAELVFADLIKHGDRDLAEEFKPLVRQNCWTWYLRARLDLDMGKKEQAAIGFKNAAPELSKRTFKSNRHDSAKLLRPDQSVKLAEGLPEFYEHVMDLLGHAKADFQVAEFAKLALQAKDAEIKKSKEDPKSSKTQKHTTELLSRLFTASLHTGAFDDAYNALTRMPASGIRHFCLQQFIKTLVDGSRVTQLFDYPWTELADEADAELAKQARKSLSIFAKPEYHKILYAWRVRRGDYRGAAQAALERLDRLRSEARTGAVADTSVVEAYLLLINSMTCVGKDEAWVLREPLGVENGNGVVPDANAAVNGSAHGVKAGKHGGPRRSLVTLEDARREYQLELDRVASLEQGRFAFDADEDPMDVL